jgi:hypothetical protein
MKENLREKLKTVKENTSYRRIKFALKKLTKDNEDVLIGAMGAFNSGQLTSKQKEQFMDGYTKIKNIITTLGDLL